jgi:hypothetical protein
MKDLKQNWTDWNTIYEVIDMIQSLEDDKGCSKYTVSVSKYLFRVYSLVGGEGFTSPRIKHPTLHHSQLDWISIELKKFIENFEPNLFDMKYYNWKLETGNAIWMSSDIGSVKASSLDEAKEIVYIIVSDMFKAINNTLNGDSDTDYIFFHYDQSAIEVTETTEDNLQQDINN